MPAFFASWGFSTMLEAPVSTIMESFAVDLHAR
jgi:hypothetical protein